MLRVALDIPLILGSLFVVAYLRTSGARRVARTVDQDPALPSIEVDGYRFHGETHGDEGRPVVIVVHGGPGWDYRALLSLEALADDYFVVFYDQRGSGLSPRVEASKLTLESSLADLDAIVDRFRGDGRVSLVGHSWGAMLVAGYLGRRPEKVSHAVLAEPGFLDAETLRRSGIHLGPRWEWSFLWFASRTWLESLHVTGPDADARRDYFMGKVAARANPEYYCGGTLPPAAHDYWRAGATAMAAVLRSASNARGRPDIDLTRGLDRFDREVLILASECNQVIGVEQQRILATYFRRAQLRVVAHSGHMMFSEQPATSVALVREYLADATSPTRSRRMAR